jgi:hypothetical protein
VCDPRPTQGGDSIVFWDGFNLSLDDAGWELSADFVQSAGQAQSTDLASHSYLRRSDVILPATPDGYVIRTRFVFTPSPETVRAVGVAAGQSATLYRNCMLRQDTAGSDLMRMHRSDEVGAYTAFDVDTALASPLADNSPYTLELEVKGGDLKCTFLQTGEFAEVATGVMAVNSGLAFRTQSVAALYNYIIVYGLGPGPAP